MSDLIDRQAEDYLRGYKAGYAAGKRSAAKSLKDLSKARLADKTANWVGIDDFPHDVWECNNCGYIHEGERTNFCPNCGADMNGEERWTI